MDNIAEFFNILSSEGKYTNASASRKFCHENGFWHKAVAVFIINSENQVLIQKRSANKKQWPNMWDISAGGHVSYNEFGYQTAIREVKEELGITLKKQDFTFIGSTTSSVALKNGVDNHFNEIYIVNKDIDLDSITLQTEEVSDVKWVSLAEIIEYMQDRYKELTPKISCWEYLCNYFSITNFQEREAGI